MKGNDVNGVLPPPPAPVTVQGEEEYIVKEVLDSRVKRYGRGSRLEYFVSWQGYGAGESSWEPAANLKNAQAKVKAFHRKYPQAPQRIAASVFAEIPFEPIDNLTESSTDLSWTRGKFEGGPSRTPAL